MVELSQLWLPIALSAVAVFFISFVMWMVSPHHKSDWEKLPDEDKLMDVMREMGVKGGTQYALPHCADAAQMKDPEWVARYNKGPKGMLIMRKDGPESMGKSMASPSRGMGK